MNPNAARIIADWRGYAVVKSLILNGIFLALMASGCATKAPEMLLEPDFSVSGKFGIKQADQGFSARFEWLQYPDSYAIDVWGPLGQGRTQLLGNEVRMQVMRGDKLLAEGAPIDVMTTHLGWSIPIKVLPAWITGEPHPRYSVAATQVDEQGHYTGFEQAGWAVSLARYMPREQGFTPAKVVAVNGSRTVTVIVREFTQ